MKLLILTQKIDKDDDILGFFHNWTREFSKRFEKVSVICLQKGSYDLPQNVEVYSLGKESGRSILKYIKNFFALIFGLHDQYDAVFVHMNQEYVILGGFFWKIMGKKVFMWRNHSYGNFLTRIAVWLSDKVFCTSPYSYTARFDKTQILGVGIDTNSFKSESNSDNLKYKKNKILFLSRVSPIKRPDMLIDALNILNKQNVDFEANFYGEALPKDALYYQSLMQKVKEFGLEEKINFHGSIPNYKTPYIYNEHGIFINLTPSGSFDKTILESAICGCIPVITNKSLKGEIPNSMIVEQENPEEVSKYIKYWLLATDEEVLNSQELLRKYILEKHSLNALMDTLCIKIRG